MYTKESWTCIFLIICSMQSVCHCCDWIRHHYGLLSAEYLSLLDQMVTKQPTYQNSIVSPAKKPERRLKRYFKKLNRKVLRKMNYSAQAWELIRKETKHNLQRLDIFKAKMH
uniref:Uncharacterized protein n=1 Tax=Oncorhynchus kisutch TaxID=8019 RepID=A0A8C7FSR4_ONCKI